VSQPNPEADDRREDGPADLLLVNGAVYTVDAARRWAQAVAVRAGRIVAVGSDDDVAALRGAASEVVDLAGRMVVPGFQDAHVHPVAAGVDLLRCSLYDVDGAEAYVAAVRAYADAHPDEAWILGGGWAMDAFAGGTPSARLLDEAVPDRPAFLPNRDGHSAWVNSAALRLAGVTRDTPDPDDGRIERTSDGEPQGTLHEGAQSLVQRLVPEPTAEQQLEGLLEGQRRLHALGITAWQDAIVDVDGEFGNLDAYLAAGADGTPTGGGVGAVWWDRPPGVGPVGDLVERRARGPAGRFRPTSVKIMQDGVCENFTAAVLEPYLDDQGRPTRGTGISFVDPEVLREAVRRLDALGFQVHFHALAERAVREALDAVEAARRANGASDGRHHLAHIQVVHPDDLPRFRELGAAANAQPLWAAHEAQMDELTIPFLGEPRWTWQYPFRSLVRHGAMLAMGSDWAVSSADPLEEIHVAVNRRMPEGYPYRVDTHEVFLPDERLDLATALAAFTIGSAYVNHLDAQTGSIEEGKLADLAVIDRNVFAAPPDEISAATVQLTYVEGERVYAAPDA